MSAYQVNWTAHHPPPADNFWVNYTFDTLSVFSVFRAVGYDPQAVSGFAFGVGLSRMAMLKYGVDDLRAFYENDTRFLAQFR